MEKVCENCRWWDKKNPLSEFSICRLHNNRYEAETLGLKIMVEKTGDSDITTNKNFMCNQFEETKQ